MNPEEVILHLLIVLVAARVGAEIAERAGQAAVLFEILVGVLIGPSVLSVVQSDEFLRVLGEIGAVLLLFEVGMQMNLRELTRVGGDSMRTAVIGILVPMALAWPLLRALGISPEVALFLAGGITATSVGITARVFGDLRALATPEARTVLGAAVADDVGGLLILTFVVAVGGGGAVSVSELATTLGVAVGFVAGAGALAIWLAPRVFAALSRRSRTEGAALVFAIAFALLVAWGAAAAHLAAIVGAFIAGLALSGSDVRDDVHRRLTPVAQLLVPVFFVQIGIDTDLSVFSKPAVAAAAAMLTVVAVAGKVASGLGVRRGRADRLLVGVAMIPRGEVGLIFAGIGLSGGILRPGDYAMLVVVVLITTVITPPLMRPLIRRSRSRFRPSQPSATAPDEWLIVTDDLVELAAEPPDLLALRLGLGAAVLCTTRSAGPELLRWLSAAEAGSQVWGQAERKAFLRLLGTGNLRSWRLLEITGLFEKSIPLLQAAVDRRRRDSLNLDPGAHLRFERLGGLKSLLDERSSAGEADPAVAVWREARTDKDLVLLAALAADVFEADPDPAASSAEFARVIGLGDKPASEIAFMVAERRLLPAAARRIEMGTEDSVLELAAHLRTRERADALYLLAVAEDAMEPWERERLDEQFELVRVALAHPDAAESGTADPVEARRELIARSLRHLPADDVARLVQAAPRRYLLAHSPDVVARHIKMTTTPLGRDEVRLEAEPEGPRTWTVHVVVRDRPGLLARVAGALSARGLSVNEAFASRMRNGLAIGVFRVRTPTDDADWDEARQTIAHALVDGSAGPNGMNLPIGGTVEIDNVASPWHTILEIRAHDRAGLLHQVASALSGAGLEIHTALVSTKDGVAVDVFHVTGRTGGKLDEAEEDALRRALAGVPQQRRRRWSKHHRQASSTPA